MNPTSTQLLSLSGEAALLLEKHRIAYANPAALELLGKNCVGQSVYAVFGPELSEIQASSFVGDLTVHGRHYLIRFSRVEGGQVVFLSPANKSPVQLNEALLFAANSALNNISIAADKARTLAEGQGDLEMLKTLTPLTRSAFCLKRLMTNASLVHGLAAGGIHTEYQMTDLSLLLRNLLETIDSMYHSHHFVLDLGQNISAPVDVSLISQLLFNLLSNCLLHARNCQRILVSLSESESRVFLTVSDDGEGIEAEELYRVFDRYCHNFSVKSAGRGAGLGLTVARAAAELHGGALLIESRPGHGTCVHVSLSKRAGSPVRLQTPQELYTGQMRSILEGLADCLPLECFTEKYTD